MEGEARKVAGLRHIDPSLYVPWCRFLSLPKRRLQVASWWAGVWWTRTGSGLDHVLCLKRDGFLWGGMFLFSSLGHLHTCIFSAEAREMSVLWYYSKSLLQNSLEMFLKAGSSTQKGWTLYPEMVFLVCLSIFCYYPKYQKAESIWRKNKGRGVISLQFWRLEVLTTSRWF